MNPTLISRNELIHQINDIAFEQSDLTQEIGYLNGRVITKNQCEHSVFNITKDSLKKILEIRGRIKDTSISSVIDCILHPTGREHETERLMDLYLDGLTIIFNKFIKDTESKEINFHAEEMIDIFSENFSRGGISTAMQFSVHYLTDRLSFSKDSSKVIINYLAGQESIDHVITCIKGSKEKEILQQLSNDIEVAKQLSKDIFSSAYDNLVIGSTFFDRTGKLFDINTTVYADMDNAHLQGDIFETINQFDNSHEKFKHIAFTSLPGCIFYDCDRSKLLFKKIYRLLKIDATLLIRFGISTSDQLFSNQEFFRQILSHSGFVREKSTNYPESEFINSGNLAYSHNRCLEIIKKYHQQSLSVNTNKGVCMIVRK